MEEALKMTAALLAFSLILSGCLSGVQPGQEPDVQGSLNQSQNQPKDGAAPSGQPEQIQQAPRNVSPSAVGACAGKGEGDSCNFSINGRDVDGTCSGRSNGALACRVRFLVPTAEITAACSAKIENNTCEFKVGNATIMGLCRDGGGLLSCMPRDPGQIPQRRGDQSAGSGI